MFVRITNTPVPNAWGSTTAIAELLGRPPSGGPEAELWLGSHHGSPSRIADADETLDGWLGDHGRSHLPFLLKVLAAASPLSLQAHPSAEQARAGFDAENAAGIPIDAAHRNYRDPFPKPEMLVVLSERFHALCGFRPEDEVLGAMDELERLGVDCRQWRERLDRGVADAFEWLTSQGPGVRELVAGVTRVAGDSPSFATQAGLAQRYPGDPGIVVSLMLHDVDLARGQAVFLPAGNIHAYLEGLGIELMTASDNVLRGGLTPKHVDVAELLRVLDFRPGPVPILEPERVGDALQWRPPGVRFRLVRVDGEAEVVLEGDSIALAAEGGASLVGSTSARALERGEAVLVTADESPLRASGVGLFVATG